MAAIQPPCAVTPYAAMSLPYPRQPSCETDCRATPFCRRKGSRVESRSPRKTLMEPGHDAEWARLAAEKRRALTPDTPIGQLLRRGQDLSVQAVGLLRPVERGGGSTRA